MIKKKISFTNQNNQKLEGNIYLPNHSSPKAFVLFAHCFTCSKNLKTVSYIAESLALKGFGVLGFDFTGLGDSEGDFSETNFSHNMSDLKDASQYLEENYESPCLLVGHSLGGTACLYVAPEIESVKAVVCIGSPYNPEHVMHLLESNLDEINNQGESKVNIGGRKFKIKKQFLDDLKDKSDATTLRNLDKSLLIFHSPQDKIVGIKNAEQLYTSAKHPKSFVSLDGASHLLTNEDDAKYVGEVIASWSKRYIEVSEDQKQEDNKNLRANIVKENKFTTEIQVRQHQLIADEPKSVQGEDLGPTPNELLSSALASCTLMTLKMYAEREDWELGNIEIQMNSQTEKSGKNKVHTLTRNLSFSNKSLSEEQINKLIEIANKCPVHKMLTEHKIKIKTKYN